MGGDNTLNDFRHIPRKRFGQHWLKDQGVLNQIVTAAELNPDDCVLEVGPGKGALTEKLIEISKGKVGAFIFVINLFDLGGSDKLTKKGFKVENLIEFPGH